MRGADSSSRSAVIVLFLLGCDLWTAAAKTLQENSDAKGKRHAVNTSLLFQFRETLGDIWELCFDFLNGIPSANC